MAIVPICSYLSRDAGLVLIPLLHLAHVRPARSSTEIYLEAAPAMFGTQMMILAEVRFLPQLGPHSTSPLRRCLPKIFPGGSCHDSLVHVQLPYYDASEEGTRHIGSSCLEKQSRLRVRSSC